MRLRTASVCEKQSFHVHIPPFIFGVCSRDGGACKSMDFLRKVELARSLCGIILATYRMVDFNRNFYLPIVWLQNSAHNSSFPLWRTNSEQSSFVASGQIVSPQSHFDLSHQEKRHIQQPPVCTTWTRQGRDMPEWVTAIVCVETRPVVHKIN